MYLSLNDQYRALRRAHTPAAIRERLGEGPPNTYLRDWVHGGIDGAITTFAILAGVAGAALEPGIMLIVGLANLLADGFALAAGNFTATRSEHDDYARIRAEEEHEIAWVPEGEREEIRQIYRMKGFEGDLLESIVSTITSDRERWMEAMLTEEHGLAASVRSAWLAAGSTFVAFLVCGFIPLLPFVTGLPSSLLLAGVFTALVFIGIGALRSRWSPSPWWRSSAETVFIGMSAAAIAYGVGAVLRTVVSVS